MEPSSENDQPDVLRRLALSMEEDLREIQQTRMPFGKYGPGKLSRIGVPLYDLPVEYLGWFERKGCWPRGRLGELLRMVYQMKADGSDSVFDAFRKAAGGKTPLRPKKMPLQLNVAPD